METNNGLKKKKRIPIHFLVEFSSQKILLIYNILLFERFNGSKRIFNLQINELCFIYIFSRSLSVEWHGLCGCQAKHLAWLLDKKRKSFLSIFIENSHNISQIQRRKLYCENEVYSMEQITNLHPCCVSSIHIQQSEREREKLSNFMNTYSITFTQCVTHSHTLKRINFCVCVSSNRKTINGV